MGGRGGGGSRGCGQVGGRMQGIKFFLRGQYCGICRTKAVEKTAHFVGNLAGATKGKFY